MPAPQLPAPVQPSAAMATYGAQFFLAAKAPQARTPDKRPKLITQFFMG